MQLDPPDHPMKAVACAIAIQAWTERWQREGLPTEPGFGRTRVGIETGEAIVGDIGIRAGSTAPRWRHAEFHGPF